MEEKQKELVLERIQKCIKELGKKACNKCCKELAKNLY